MKRTYYIVLEKYYTETQMVKSWVIRETEYDLDTTVGLLDEISALERGPLCHVLIQNWQLLDGGSRGLTALIEQLEETISDWRDGFDAAQGSDYEEGANACKACADKIQQIIDQAKAGEV